MSNLTSTNFTIETEQEEDGRWIAEVLEIPGALVYASNQQQAIAQVKALALRAIATRQNKIKPSDIAEQSLKHGDSQNCSVWQKI